MNSHRALVATALLAGCFLLTLLATPVFAAPKTKIVTPPDRRYLVKAVDASSNSITIFSSIEKTSQTYRIDDTTSVQVNGSPAKFADIKAGMEVAAYTERDSDDLDSVSLMSKTSAPVGVDPSKPVYTGSESTIEGVLPDQNSVVIYTAQSKAVHTYRIDGVTALKVNGVNGAFSDIKVGMVVKDYVERDNDDLDSLTLTGYDDDTSTPTKKKKK
jgi:hypothetical protein